MKRSPRAFTLIELMILMALTTLLISILLPTVGKTRERTRGIMCMANLRQIGLLHIDPLVLDGLWGNSAYDFPHGIYEHYEYTNGGTHYAPGRNVEIETGSRSEFGFRESMEHNALPQPQYWKLCCPEAVQEDQNSYGMNYRVVNQPIVRFMTSRDLIFGCSDWKVVDVARNFAFRHVDKASFLFGDEHVEERGQDLFSKLQWNQTSNRYKYFLSNPQK